MRKERAIAYCLYSPRRDGPLDQFDGTSQSFYVFPPIACWIDEKLQYHEVNTAVHGPVEFELLPPPKGIEDVRITKPGQWSIQ